MLWHGPIILGIISLVQCKKLHETMTDDEISKVFGKTRDTVPEYEVVPIMHNFYKRSNSNVRMQFNAFGKAIDTYLHSTDGQLAGVDTPVWLAFTNNNGKISYRKMKKGIVGRVAAFYHNPLNFSSVLVLKDDSFPCFEGNIHNLTIRSLPARLKKLTRSKREIEPSNSSGTLIQTDYHVIIKLNSFTSQEVVSESVEGKTSEILNLLNETDDLRTKRSSRDFVFPSVMITTNYEGSKIPENDDDYYDEIIYQLTFWNAVDLRFRQFQEPKIRLRIAGIIIGQDRTATPYINNNMVKEKFDGDRAWFEMQSFWKIKSQHPEFPNEAYHFVVTMTNYNMIRKNVRQKHVPALGVATVQRLCQSENNNDYLKPVAIVHDNGGFDGILVATHELGHLLGLRHDNSDGDECDVSHGFIMQRTFEVTNKNLEWSPCSLRELSTFLANPDRNCTEEPLQFYPPGIPVDRFLPGSFLDDNEQCQARGYAYACESPKICETMKCRYKGWKAFTEGWWCMDSHAAAEGTICAPDHKCIFGECTCVTEKCLLKLKDCD